eukprot:TRINITY_DN3687_c0_g2_i1.p1 TRINITY_DN3687_c0_g2~~TRINITY_DN3687_c0_g2_i1.p1  ORF type:complete len:667 (+),score=90.81 TRINITY_DN3687_c0_g2_i1:86-2002(+)
MAIAAFLAGCLLLGQLVAEYVIPTGAQPKTRASARTDRHGAQLKVLQTAPSSVYTSSLPFTDEFTRALATGTVIGALAAACVAFVVAAKGIPGVQATGYSPTSGAVFNITHNHYYNSPDEAAGLQHGVERAASQAMPVVGTGVLLSAGLGEFVSPTSKGRREDAAPTARGQLCDQGSVQNSCEVDIKPDRDSSPRTPTTSKPEEHASQQAKRLSDLVKQVDPCDALEESDAKQNILKGAKHLEERLEGQKQRESPTVHHAQASEEVATERTTRATLGSSPPETMQLRELFEREIHREPSSSPHVQKNEVAATQHTTRTTWRLKLFKSAVERVMWSSKVTEIRQERVALNAVEAQKMDTMRTSEDKAKSAEGLPCVQTTSAKSGASPNQTSEVIPKSSVRSESLIQPQNAADAVERAHQSMRQVQATAEQSMVTSPPHTTSTEEILTDVWKTPSKKVSDKTVKRVQVACASQRTNSLPVMRNRHTLSSSPSSGAMPVMRSRHMLSSSPSSGAMPVMRNRHTLSSLPSSGTMTPRPAMRNSVSTNLLPVLQNRGVMTPQRAMGNTVATTLLPVMPKRAIMTPPWPAMRNAVTPTLSPNVQHRAVVNPRPAVGNAVTMTLVPVMQNRTVMDPRPAGKCRRL